MDLREKLLLRQIEVLINYPKDKVDFNEISFQIQEEDKVLNLLRNYGLYSNIDCFLPYLENENEENENFLFEKPVPSQVIDNKRLNASIINLTLKESQNLITKSTDLVASVSDKLKADLSKINRQNVIAEEKEISPTDTKSIKHKNEVKAVAADESSKLKRNDTTTSSKKKTLKNISNLTLNSCGGNIILKNISNLTINGCKSSSLQHPTKVENVERTSCPDTSSNGKCEGNYYQCDFYERLISENEVLKRSIVNQSLCTTTFPDPITTTCMSPTGLMLNNSSQQKKSDEKRDNETFSINSTPDETMTSITTGDEGKSCCDEPIEEITTATMRVDGFSDHSPMIQCWLSKMLHEPETESQNITEFLEISNIM